MFHIIKNAMSAIAKSSTFDRFVETLENVDGQRPGFLRVLTYHRVDEPARRPWLDPGLISAVPKEFDEQMAYLAAHYQPVTVSDILAAVKSRNIKDLPPRAVLVTFDDGYCDFLEQAWPILKRHKIPATLFVPTAYPNHQEQTFWWNDLYQVIQNTHKEILNTSIGTFVLTDNVSRNQAYQRLKNYMKTLNHSEAILIVRELCSQFAVQPAANNVLSWDALRKLNKEGLTLGAHTRTHPLLNRISLEEVREEVVGSFQDLQREIGFALPIFAYPSGEFSDDVVNILKHEGFSLAFTTERGINQLATMNPLRIQRINVGGKTSLPILRAQLLTWTVHFKMLQSRLNAYM